MAAEKDKSAPRRGAKRKTVQGRLKGGSHTRGSKPILCCKSSRRKQMKIIL